jgi:hypothetical protein
MGLDLDASANPVILLDAVSITGAGNHHYKDDSEQIDTSKRIYEVILAGTGAITATCVVEGSLNGENWEPIVTFTVTGSDLVTDYYKSFTQWIFTRGNITGITGTSAKLTLLMGL